MKTKQEAINKTSEILNKLYKDGGFDSNDTAKAVLFFFASGELEHTTGAVWLAVAPGDSEGQWCGEYLRITSQQQ